MKIWVGVTDEDWYRRHVAAMPDEVNFWQPSGNQQFRALQPGEPFLFKLHSPKNFIVGGGFFVRYSQLPTSLAWDAFGTKNGVSSLVELKARVAKYRNGDIGPDPMIGCNVLTAPFFIDQSKWVPVPASWAPNIVRGKTYDTNDGEGVSLWQAVEQARTKADAVREATSDDEEAQPRFGAEFLARSRLGQGAFRVLVTDAYQRRCAVTGEKTLPVLEAAHIKPYQVGGQHRIDNGMLLRSDIHKLFDCGYVTVTPQLRIEVSSRLRTDWHNGREYYAYHGKELAIRPDEQRNLPSREFLEWHNENTFKA
jgi:putative restriction endonuclease